MICAKCGGNMRESIVTLAGDVKEQRIAVTMPGIVCDTCGHQSIHGSQFGNFQRRVADEYRRLNSLLTGDDLRKARKRLRMSQRRFAEYLNVGSASLKRWELGEIQTRQMDSWVRIKTDVTAAEESLRRLYELESPVVVRTTSVLQDEAIYRARRAQAIQRRQRSHRNLRVIASKGSGLAA